MTENSLQEAIAALKAGRRKRARAILAHLLRQDPRNEEAWLWLSGAVERDSERLLCLRQVLAINPNNERARQGIELLLSKGVTLPILAPAEPAPVAPPPAPPELAPSPAELEGQAQPQAQPPAQEELAEATPREEALKEAPAPAPAPSAIAEAQAAIIEEAQPPEIREDTAPEAQAVEATPFVPPPVPQGFVLPEEMEAEAEPSLSLRGLLVLILLLIILIAAITILLSQRGI